MIPDRLEAYPTEVGQASCLSRLPDRLEAMLYPTSLTSSFVNVLRNFTTPLKKIAQSNWLVDVAKSIASE
jgi:hypothetical protein